MLQVSLYILCLASTLKITCSIDTCKVSSDVSGMCRKPSDCTTLQKGTTTKLCSGRNNLVCCPLWKRTTWPVNSSRKPNVQSRTTEASQFQNGCGQRTVSRRKSKRETDLEEDEDMFNLTTDMIVGGRAAVKGAWPWMAALLELRNIGFSQTASFFCGGSILTSSYVLTAAHCLYPYMRDRRRAKANLRKLRVRLGAHSKTDGITYSVMKMSYHSNYGRNYLNDIGLVKISPQVIFDAHVSPICLPTADETYSEPYYITGWGTTSSGGSASNVLREAPVKMIPLSTCKRNYARISMKINNSQLCAGRGDTDTCQGDSGGPLVMYSKSKKSWIQIGITSYGNGCGDRRYPGVYTAVKSYTNWINSKINQ